MSKRFSKPEITLDRIYSEFADEGYCKDSLLDVRFKKGFACPFCGSIRPPQELLRPAGLSLTGEERLTEQPKMWAQ